MMEVSGKGKEWRQDSKSSSLEALLLKGVPL